MADPLQLDKIVAQVHECMCSTLTAVAEQVNDESPAGDEPVVTQPPCPCRSCVVPGQTVEWNCDAPPPDQDCGGGQLTTRVTQLFPSTTFPARDVSATGCDTSTIVAEIVVTLLRCMPLFESEDTTVCPPSCDQLTEAARVQHIDGLALTRAAMCCIPGTGPIGRKRKVVIQAMRAVGPQAAPACVGWEMTLLVDIGSACCPTMPLATPDPNE